MFTELNRSHREWLNEPRRFCLIIRAPCAPVRQLNRRIARVRYEPQCPALHYATDEKILCVRELAELQK